MIKLWFGYYGEFTWVWLETIVNFCELKPLFISYLRFLILLIEVKQVVHKY